MTGRAFLELALELTAGETEQHRRSAVSRGYYAAYHIARELVQSCDVVAPKRDVHNKLQWCCWIILLAVPTGGCEWLLRRYRPRLRWSLRTMLAAVALVAAFCAWFAAARKRANLQDPIIADLEQHDRCVAVDRPGPKWLEFVVPDRFRRRIVGIDMYGPVDETCVVRLGQLPRLKYLKLHVERLTPDMAATLRNSRELRWLYIHLGSAPPDGPRPEVCRPQRGRESGRAGEIGFARRTDGQRRRHISRGARSVSGNQASQSSAHF